MKIHHKVIKFLLLLILSVTIVALDPKYLYKCQRISGKKSVGAVTLYDFPGKSENECCLLCGLWIGERTCRGFVFSQSNICSLKSSLGVVTDDSTSTDVIGYQIDAYQCGLICLRDIRCLSVSFNKAICKLSSKNGVDEVLVSESGTNLYQMIPNTGQPQNYNKATYCLNDDRTCQYKNSPACKEDWAYLGPRLKTTISGKWCDDWNGTNTGQHNFTKLPGNSCSNPDGRVGPWCFTSVLSLYETLVAEEPCVPNCTHATTSPILRCVAEDESCYYSQSNSCLKNVYWGTKNVTKSGNTCHRWDARIPANSKYYHTLKDEENYCRNPDNDQAPWCYSTNPTSTFESCFDPCESPLFSLSQCLSDDGCWRTGLSYCSTPTSYVGQQNVTISGRTCQRWDAQFPWTHSRVQFIDQENYCRNPDGEPTPWCYTTDLEQRWELCFNTC